MHCDTLKQDSDSTVRGDGGSRVGEVRAGTTSPMPELKCIPSQSVAQSIGVTWVSHSSRETTAVRNGAHQNCLVLIILLLTCVMQASQWHEMYCHDLEAMSSNPSWVELAVRSTSVLSRTWTKNIISLILQLPIHHSNVSICHCNKSGALLKTIHCTGAHTKTNTIQYFPPYISIAL